jgi:hypothetical protein
VVVEFGTVYNVRGVPADEGIAPLVLTLNVFAIIYPKAIARGKALGSVSVIVPVTATPLGNVIAFVDVLILNNSKLSDPSLILILSVFVVALSTQIVPATAELGAELPT